MDTPTQIMRSLMVRSPNSFVGFFDTVADVLKTLGDEWLGYAFLTQDKMANSWGKVFIEASKSINQITIELQKVKDEYDAREARTAETRLANTAKP